MVFKHKKENTIIKIEPPKSTIRMGILDTIIAAVPPGYSVPKREAVEL